jgi:hypothetical protein
VRIERQRNWASFAKELVDLQPDVTVANTASVTAALQRMSCCPASAPASNCSRSVEHAHSRGGITEQEGHAEDTGTADKLLSAVGLLHEPHCNSGGWIPSALVNGGSVVTNNPSFSMFAMSSARSSSAVTLSRIVRSGLFGSPANLIADRRACLKLITSLAHRAAFSIISSTVWILARSPNDYSTLALK